MRKGFMPFHVASCNYNTERYVLFGFITIGALHTVTEMNTLFSLLSLLAKKIGARGSVVVKALCYKPEGRGFDTG
jgi:hypothetical protein